MHVAATTAAQSSFLFENLSHKRIKRHTLRNAMTMVTMGTYQSVTIFEAADHAGGNGF